MADNATDFDIDIGVSGVADAVSAAAAVDKLADELEKATGASSAAAEAMKAAGASYKEAETTADKAAKALEKINLAVAAQRDKVAAAAAAGGVFSAGAEKAASVLAKLEAQQSSATAAVKKANDALAIEAVALDKAKKAAGDAASLEERLTKSHAAAEKASKAAAAAASEASGTRNLGKLKGALGDLGGPLGGAAQKAVGFADAWQDLKETIGVAGPYAAVAVAIAAIVASVAALTAATIVGIVQIGTWAFTLADAAEQQQALYDGMAQSAEGGRELDAAISGLLKRVPLTRAELDKMAGDLAKAGKRGAELTDSLSSAATAAAQAKFGPQWEKQMNSLAVMSARLQENFTGRHGIFSGLNTGPVKEGLSSIVSLFDEGTASSKAIKAVFESLFQPLLDGLAEFLPKAQSAFIQFEILVLKALIAIKPFGSKILLVAEAFGILAAVIVGVLAVGFTLMIAPLVILAGLLTGVIALAIKFGSVALDVAMAIVNGPAMALDFVVEKFKEFFDWLSNHSLADVGGALIDGLVSGITGAASKITDSLQGAVTGAMDQAKSFLGIHSPSTLFAEELGAPMGQGVAVGVEGEQATVGSAVETITAPDTSGTPAAAPGGGGSGSISSGAFAGAQFNFYGVEGAEDAESRFEGVLTRILEGDVAKLGGAVPVGG